MYEQARAQFNECDLAALDPSCGGDQRLEPALNIARTPAGDYQPGMFKTATTGHAS